MRSVHDFFEDVSRPEDLASRRLPPKRLASVAKSSRCRVVKRAEVKTPWHLPCILAAGDQGRTPLHESGLPGPRIPSVRGFDRALAFRAIRVLPRSLVRQPGANARVAWPAAPDREMAGHLRYSACNAHI